MSAGTIKLTNGSTAIVGTSTTFTTDLKSGDVISTTISGVSYTLFVGTVTSNTALTLSDAFTGPTTSGAAYVAVPAQTLSRLPAQLATQTSEAVRRMLQDNANWQAFYSGAGDISITVPDGSATGKQVSGPSWAKVASVANSSWIDRGSVGTSDNISAYNPVTTEGEWYKSTSTGLTVANGFPANAAVGTLKVVAGGRYGGTQIYTAWNGMQWVRGLTAAWNGSDGPWSSWAISSGGFGAIGNVDLNTLGPDYAGSNFSLLNSTFATAANNYAITGSPGIGYLEIYTGGNICQQRYTSRYGRVFTRTLTAAWDGVSGPWGNWLEVGYQSPSDFYDADLNLLISPGQWNVTTANSANLPVPAVGVLKVTQRASSNQVIQEYTCVSGSGTYANRKFIRTMVVSGTTVIWTAWDEDMGLARMLSELGSRFGIGAANPVQLNIDWQTYAFVNGASLQIDLATMTNAPAIISGVATTGTLGFNVLGVAGDTSSTTTNSWLLGLVSIYTNGTGAARRMFQVIYRGVNGARVWSVFEIYGDNRIIDVAHGGTGAASLAGARTALDVFATGEIGPEFITGLDLSVGPSSVTVSPGAAYIPSGGIARVTSAITQNYTGTANSWLHVYLYLSGTTPAIEVSATAPAVYSYPAHQKTGAASRRYIGSIRVGASGGIPAEVTGGVCRYMMGYNATTVLAGGKATTEVAIVINTFVPPVTNKTVLLEAYNSMTDASVFVYSKPGGTGVAIARPGMDIYAELSSVGYPYVYYYLTNSSVGPGFYCNVTGYSFVR